MIKYRTSSGERERKKVWLGNILAKDDRSKYVGNIFDAPILFMNDDKIIYRVCISKINGSKKK